MKKILELIDEEVRIVFNNCGYDEKYGKTGLSNRPDLCEYQCNGCMAAAKKYGKAPIEIAKEITEKLSNNIMFEEIKAVMPGFINIKLNPDFICNYIKNMFDSEKLGIEPEEPSKTIIVDYGGANVAKPLHIGHLRSAIIGESIKRMGLFMGNHMIADVHLGDWGLQMGLIIEELHERKPELLYFDKDYNGQYPKESPFTISELEEIYPAASIKSKTDVNFKERAGLATLKLQSGYKPYNEIWKHIIGVSIKDLKKNYDNLDVSFDLWKGESDAQPYIPALIEDLSKKGIAYESEGALIVDIAEPSDNKELPPCIIRKSDGAALYATSDLATMIEREKLYNPDEYIYITDKRQELHFIQVFRVALKSGIIADNKELKHIGFGTMNGSDGKPFKTRDGGVMRLENLIFDINEAVYNKIIENRDTDEVDARNTARIVGLAALKYGDLSNQASKDYVFDIDRFTSFEGNTGPYILYTIVRIKSILAKYKQIESTDISSNDFKSAEIDVHKKLHLEIVKYNEAITGAWQDLAPNKICQYIYSLAESCNSFYHEVKILSEEDKSKKKSYLATIKLAEEILNNCISILGMDAPEMM